MIKDKQVLVFGATGNIGGAVSREMLKRDWHVLAVTRNPTSAKATSLARLGAKIIQADMEDSHSLEIAFKGIQRVFSVQNWTKSGVDGETRQAKLVADAAKSAGVKHLVFGSAGTGEPDTGVPHFDNKLEIEAYMRTLGLPITVVRPTPFMELMTEKEFFPPLVTWGIEPKLLGWDMPIPWVAVRDIGIAIANIFEDPQTWIGSDISLTGDVKTLAECKEVFTSVTGKKPFGLALPLWLFRKMAEEEFIIMWKWMASWIPKIGSESLWQDVNSSRELCPEMLDMESWLRSKHNRTNGLVYGD